MAKNNLLERYAANSLLVAFVGLLGIVISASVTHWITKRTVLAEQEAKRSQGLETQRLEFKKQAYADFLTGQTLNLEASAKGDEANQVADPEKKKTLLDEASAKASESRKVFDSAKLRIILLGSDKVLCSMAEYWATRDKFPECTDIEEKKRDAAIYRNMRRDFFSTLGAKEPPDIDDRILVPYLRGCVLPGGPQETVDQVCKRL